MNKEIKNKLQRGLALTAKESQDLYKYIKTLDQEPKMGHWIDDKCSVCGKGTEDFISSREWYRNEEPNFCPFCGAKMAESQESEK